MLGVGSRGACTRTGGTTTWCAFDLLTLLWYPFNALCHPVGHSLCSYSIHPYNLFISWENKLASTVYS